MQDAAHTVMMVSDIATSAGLIDLCHKAILLPKSIEISVVNKLTKLVMRVLP